MSDDEKDTEGGSDNAKQPQMQTPIFRHDFKIVGQINEKGGLSYKSLCCQIDNGKRRGYDELEIVDAVIKSINTGLKLRSYLEGLDDLKLDVLRAVLRTHFHEKTATELYQELGQLAQGPKEDVQHFIIRGMDMRQKVLFASQQEQKEAGLSYSPALVAAMFRRALLTGISNEVIRTEVKTIFERIEPATDVELLTLVQSSSSAEKERQLKLCKKTKINSVDSKESKVFEKVKVSEPSVDMAASGHDLCSSRSDMTGSMSKQNVNAELVKEIESLKVKVAELEGRVNTNNESTRSHPNQNTAQYLNQGFQPRFHYVPYNQSVDNLVPYPYYPPGPRPSLPNQNSQYGGPRPGCPTCKQAGGNVRCTHCWLCGGDDHFKFNCNKPRAGN